MVRPVLFSNKIPPHVGGRRSIDLGLVDLELCMRLDVENFSKILQS